MASSSPAPDSPSQPRRSRGLSRLAWLTGRPATSTSPMLEPLIRAARANHPKADFAIVQRAYEVAKEAHSGQRRKSGDPYITHPIAVATILAELGMLPSTLAAALLHDTVEDTDYSLEQLRRDFGDEIAMMVDGVTKLDKIEYGAAAQSETVRKMVVAMARDIRVLVIKLADRLHNARTWRYVPPSSSERKAKETLEIFAPLAHRLGMNTIKWELEDLSFQVLYPKVYDEIVRMVAERAPKRERFLATVKEQIDADLKTSRIRATITGRPKHYYSIYQKMVVRGHDLDDIYDLVGVRVLVDSVRECYAALGAVHADWNPVPGRFKDYIAMPKFNMYQSLHTTVIGPGGRPVEIQIRTHEMHRRAEFGVAAHWKYKDLARATATGESGSAGTAKVGDTGAIDDVQWLRQLMDWQRETQDPDEFLDSLRFEVGAKEVFVFTPKGDVMSLPAGSTPVDFAYAVHTDVGHHTMGSRVNGRLVSLEQELSNGDVVEIFTSKDENAGPSRDWLTFVKSPRARNKIRHWFSKERREEAIDSGRDQLARAMRRHSLPASKLMSQEALGVVAEDAKLADVSALYAAIGQGHMSAQHVVDLLAKAVGADTEEPPEPQHNRTGRSSGHHSATEGVLVKGMDDVLVKLARCCTPVPGDDIVGFVTRGTGVSVHRTDCTNVTSLSAQPERMIEVEWADRPRGVYLVQIQVEALDRSALLFDITRVLSENHVNILSASVATSRARVAQSRFVFEIGDPTHLDSVLAAVRKVDGVFDIYRINGG